VTNCSTLNVGWRVQARFIVELHIKEISTLYMIQSFFGGIGNLTINTKKNSARFTVVNFNNLLEIILPHFENYPLQSAKKIDFESWKECIKIMANKNHLNKEGLEKIVYLKGIMNWGLSDQLKKSFPNITSLSRPSYFTSEENLNPDWVSGFMDGDGSFFISIRPLKNQVVAVVSVGLHIREMPLLIKIKEFFSNIGSIYVSGVALGAHKKNVVEWKVSKLSNLKLIITHFDSYPLMGLKSYNFIIWKEIVLLIENKAHLTTKGLTKIKSLKDQLNQWN
jgi:LAGLIDADG endonuclease